MWKTYQLSRFNNRTDPFLSGHASRRRRKEDSTKLLSTTGRRKEGSKKFAGRLRVCSVRLHHLMGAVQAACTNDPCRARRHVHLMNECMCQSRAIAVVRSIQCVCHVMYV
jgi:hypothetical protein